MYHHPHGPHSGDGESELPLEVDLDQDAKAAIKRHHHTNLELGCEKGGSSTLTTIPTSEHGFFEVKSDFHDHVPFHYCWPLDNLPRTCPCDSNFTIDHVQIHKLSGFINL